MNNYYNKDKSYAQDILLHYLNWKDSYLLGKIQIHFQKVIK